MKTLRRLLVVALLAGAGPAQAACSRPVKVAISPMGRNMMVEADGSVGGLVPDFLQLAAARTGCRFDFITVPRARALAMLQSGEIDLLPGATRTAERDQAGIFVHMYNSRAMLIAGAGRSRQARGGLRRSTRQ